MMENYCLVPKIKKKQNTTVNLFLFILPSIIRKCKDTFLTNLVAKNTQLRQLTQFYHILCMLFLMNNKLQFCLKQNKNENKIRNEDAK